MFEEHTCERQNVQPRSQGLSLALGNRERDPGNEGDQRSRQADFLSTPDSSLANSHFATHARVPRVSLLTGSLFPNDENQCRDFRVGLEANWSS